MRIGFDAKRYFLNSSGLGNYSRDLVRILETYYPDHDYIKYTPKLKSDATVNSNFTTKLPQSTFARLFPSFWRSKWIVDDLKRDHIDIFHGLSGEIPIGLQKTNIKSVVSIHDLIFLKFPELYKKIDRNIYDKKFRHAVNNADQIVAISEQTKADIIHHYGISPENIKVIYQGCHQSFKQEKTAQDKAELRRKYNLPDNFLLNVGSIEARKNALQIVKAITNIDIPLVIIGKETSYTDQIRSYIHANGMGKRVHILQGFTMDELATIYSMADIFVYPSIYEGFGIPIIEALYAGTPVITNREGVFPEAGGPSSCYIDPNNVEEMTNAIQTILTDTAKRDEMVKNGILYTQRFNDEVLAKQWMDVYQSL